LAVRLRVSVDGCRVGWGLSCALLRRYWWSYEVPLAGLGKRT
jgi:hypothetical protein